jgi:UDP-2-acetamido-3-amino-2,3-dideoxy-glucuronate N-acetyltransferase
MTQPKTAPAPSALDPVIHPSAEVSPLAKIGAGTRIWNYAQVRERAEIGESCIVAKNVYIDFEVRIGARCKIQNNCSLYHGTTLEDGVFLGPHVVLANDKIPRAINPDGSLKGAEDWQVSHALICYGASLGAGVIVLPGVTVGRFAMIGSGAVVTKNVPDYALMVGNPARQIGWVDARGARVATPPKNL